MSIHRGELQQDAPGLYGSLVRQFGQSAELDRFSAIYRITCTMGGLFEGAVPREEGGSFNPRPARICHILMHDCKEGEAAVLAAAMLACCGEVGLAQLNREAAGPYAAELAIAAEALEFNRGGGGEAAERIFMALTLDEVRHLHMTELPAVARMNLLSDVRRLTARSAGNSANKRLSEMLAAAADRYERSFGT